MSVDTVQRDLDVILADDYCVRHDGPVPPGDYGGHWCMVCMLPRLALPNRVRRALGSGKVAIRLVTDVSP